MKENFLKLTIIKFQHFNTLTLNFFCHFHFSLNYGLQFLDKPRASAHHERNGHCFAYPEIGGQFSVISNNFVKKKFKKKNENKSTCKFPIISQIPIFFDDDDEVTIWKK